MHTPTPTRQMQNLLDTHADLGPLPIESLTPEQARQIPLPDRAAVALYGQHMANRVLAPMPPPVGKVQNILIPGPEMQLLKVYEGVTHEFFGLSGLVNEAGEAVALASKNLRKAFGTTD